MAIEDIALPEGLNPTYLLNREGWYETLKHARRNPALMLKAGVDYTVSATNGELDFVDVSNPFTLSMEFGAQLAANNFGYFAEADKKHYPALATSMNDLYHHMSTELYRGRFGSPSRATFRFFFKFQELLKWAVPYGTQGMKKIILPRGGVVTVDDIVYTLLNHIEIRVSQYNAVQVVYNTENRDYFEILESNILNHYYMTSKEQEEFVIIEVPMLQVEVDRQISDITHGGNIYNQIFPYKDKFIQARVYLRDKWDVVKEIQTTHSALVYDPNKVTARLSVLEGNLLKVDIPLLYYTIGEVDDMAVIVEIYTTKGKIDIPLKELSSKMAYDFSPEYGLSKADTAFTATLPHFDILMDSLHNSQGGADGLTFETMKQWVIQGGVYKESPITHANIKRNANIMGYDISVDIDNITGRIFQASREIEQSAQDEFTRGVGCSIESVAIRPSHLEGHPHVRHHYGRMTILPEMLYRTINGMTSVLHPNEIPTLENSTNIDTFIRDINKLEYIASPFYYCLDYSEGIMNCRAYHMDEPYFISKYFVDSNNQIQMLANTDEVVVTRKEWGYSIVVTTQSSDNYKALNMDFLFCQLAFKPVGQNNLAYINGECIGKKDENWVWEFKLETTFDFDARDNLIINNFKVQVDEARKLPISLDSVFHIYYGVYDQDLGEISYNPINYRVGGHLLERGRQAIVLTENQIKIKLGHALTDLWKNVRTVKSIVDYKRHQENVPLLYTENIYKLGEDGLPIHRLDEEGNSHFEIEHRIGEPVLDGKGNPVYKHHKGDVILGDDGQPLIDKPKETQWIIDILFIDGIYRFSTDKIDNDYIRAIPNKIVNWLETDIKQMKQNLLERTDLFFVPKRTMGYVNIIAEGGIERTIFNRLPFKVKYYLKQQAYLNDDLKMSITKSTSKIINDALRERTVSKDIIENKLREIGGKEHIYGVQVVDMGLGSSINTFTMKGQSNYCSVRRQIALLSDGTLKVKEDIQIEFINHDGKLWKKYEQDKLY